MVLSDGVKIFVNYKNNRWELFIDKSFKRNDVLDYLVKNYNLEYNKEESIGIFEKINGNQIHNIGSLSEDGDEYNLNIYPFVKETHTKYKSFYISARLGNMVSLEINPSNTIAYLKYLVEKKGLAVYEALGLSNIRGKDTDTLEYANVQPNMNIGLNIRAVNF